MKGIITLVPAIQVPVTVEAPQGVLTPGKCTNALPVPKAREDVSVMP